MGRTKQRYLQTCAKCANADHLAHTKSIIRVFALHSHILVYPMNTMSQLAESC